MCSLTGYAGLSREIVSGLDKLGTDISLKILDESMLKSSTNMMTKEILDLIKRCKVKELPKNDVVLSIGTPPQYSVAGKLKVAVGMFEAYALPPNWLQLMNKQDLILTPSTFNQQVFIKQGLSEKKIAVIPPAVDSNLFNENVEPFYVSELKYFTILFLGQLILRKGWDKLVKAVLRTFRTNDDVLLILKLPPPNSDAQETGMIERVKAIKQEAGSSKVKVYCNFSAVGIEQVPKVYAALNHRLPDKVYPYLGNSEPRGIFCLPSLGEGCGLTYLESMASGTLTLGTNSTGSFFLNPENSIIIETGLPTRNIELELEHPLYQNMPMPTVSTISISKALTRAYNMSQEERNKITVQARKDAEGYTYDACCRVILNEIQKRI
jgi:glycosyltransferase involved in cell wall biosynthesis